MTIDAADKVNFNSTVAAGSVQQLAGYGTTTVAAPLSANAAGGVTLVNDQVVVDDPITATAPVTLTGTDPSLPGVTLAANVTSSTGVTFGSDVTVPTLLGPPPSVTVAAPAITLPAAPVTLPSVRATR